MADHPSARPAAWRHHDDMPPWARRVGVLLLDRLLPRHKDGKRYLTVGEVMAWGLIWTACLWLNQLLWLHDHGW